MQLSKIKGCWRNSNNKMKGKWYLERNLSLLWKCSQMSEYIAFESQYATNSWTLKVQHVFTICSSNMRHQPVIWSYSLYGQIWFELFLSFYWAMGSLVKSSSNILLWISFDIMHGMNLFLSNLWTNPKTTLTTYHHFMSPDTLVDSLLPVSYRKNLGGVQFKTRLWRTSFGLQMSNQVRWSSFICSCETWNINVLICTPKNNLQLHNANETWPTLPPYWKN